MSYRGLRLSIFAGAFVFGVVMSSLGSLLPELTRANGLDRAAAGGLFLAMNFAMLVGSLLFGPVCDRFGFRALLLVSTAFVGGAFGGLAAAGSRGTIVAALALLGLGGGALNGATNALLAESSPDRRESELNLLGIFFGAGALLMPFLIGSFLDAAGLRAIVAALGALAVLPLALFAAAAFPAPKHAAGLDWRHCARTLASPLLALFALLLFFQSGNEFTVAGWVSTYLTERFGIAPRAAAYILAGYWIAIVVARLAIARFVKSVAPEALVAGSAVLALAGAVGLVTVAAPAAAAACVALIGIGFAAIFPTTLAQAASAFPAYSATAFTVLFGSALTGGMTSPWLVGRIAQARGLRTALEAVAFNCAAVLLLQLAIRRRRSSKARVVGNSAVEAQPEKRD